MSDSASPSAEHGLTDHDARLLEAIRSTRPASRDFVVAPGGLTGTTVSSSKSLVLILLAVALLVGGYAGYEMMSHGSSAPATATATASAVKPAARTKPVSRSKAKTAAPATAIPSIRSARDESTAYKVGYRIAGLMLLLLLALLGVFLVRRLRARSHRGTQPVAQLQETALAAPPTEMQTCANGHDMGADHRFCQRCGAEAAA